jgi:predicted PurR-regulated permease PerM
MTRKEVIMELNKKNMRKLMLLIAFGIAVYLGLLNLNRLSDFAGFIGGVFEPIIFGLVLAYIFNVLNHRVETYIFSPLNRRFKKRWPKIRRPVSIAVSLLIVFGILALIVLIILPDLVTTITGLTNNIPTFFNQLQNNYNDFIVKNTYIYKQLKNIHIDWTSISQMLAQYGQQLASNLLGLTISVTANVFRISITFILGFVIAINMLLQKEVLQKQIHKLLFAYLPHDFTKRVIKVFTLADQAFSEFIVGQCLGAVVLGILCFIGMEIFRFPFALLISVLVTFLALIPILGAIFSVLVGVLLILTVSPFQALLFAIYFIILQQLEGNLIFPKLVGSKMGLPALWVLVAITLGGNAFGIVGMLISIPIFSVLHILLRENVNERLAKAQLNKPEHDK